MVSNLYVEGGGDSKALRTECREGFRRLLERAGIQGRMPRISACGSRRAAYEDSCRAVTDPNQEPLLLVDAEAPVTESSPWDHVRTRHGDGWSKPSGAVDDQLHLMVQCMEAWFLADRDAVRRFFGQGFHENALPAPSTPIEQVAKQDLLSKLAAATRHSISKGTYGKGRHSYKLLATLDPALIQGSSSWASRFFSSL